jgi:FSR family fosmidomycin resistance protein-like MFS transporter
VSIAAGDQLRADRRSLIMLSAGHLVNDMNPGAVPALLPFLVSQRHISYAAAAGLVLASTLSSSVVQPLAGHLADRRPAPWLMPLGVVLSGLGIGLTGIVTAYWLTFLCVLLAGAGVGAFHPEAARFARFVSGRRRATAMSIFSVGGGIGFGLGPALVTPLVLALGLPGTVFMAVPALVVALAIALELPRLGSFRPEAASSERAQALHAASNRPAFRRLTVIAILRSVVYIGVITFAPLYFLRIFHASPAQANTALTLMLLAGPAGTLAIGPLADRFGRRTVLMGALVAIAGMMALFLASGRVLATLALVVIGGCVVATFSLALVMAQEYLPGNLGLASGLVLGLPDGVGGLSAPVYGVIGDHFGLRMTLTCAAVLSVLLVAFGATLPRLRDRPG